MAEIKIPLPTNEQVEKINKHLTGQTSFYSERTGHLDASTTETLFEYDGPCYIDYLEFSLAWPEDITIRTSIKTNGEWKIVPQLNSNGSAKASRPVAEWADGLYISTLWDIVRYNPSSQEIKFTLSRLPRFFPEGVRFTAQNNNATNNRSLAFNVFGRKIE